MSKLIATVATFGLVGYVARSAVRPHAIPPHPYPAYVTSSQKTQNPNDHISELNRLVITTPIPSSPPSSSEPAKIPTAIDLTQAMFTSWVMLPERVALNAIHGNPLLRVARIAPGEKLLGIFRVEEASDDYVEITWYMGQLTGTHFLRRELLANGTNKDAGEVAWRFETVAWKLDTKDSPTSGFKGRILSAFHELYARMLLSHAVAKLGY